MIKLLSKLQYKNFEKGEFTDIQQRNLDETLQLISLFPWEEQRPNTDIQPTGPSVTIEDGNGAYLKVGLYFNQKFCLYLLNKQHEFFEYHTTTLQELYDFVTKFFNGVQIENLFDKHLISVGKVKHFKTQSFIYRLNTVRFIGLYFLLSILTASIICSLILGTIIYLPVGILLLLVAYGLFKLHKIYLSHYQKSRNVTLRLSRGIDEFTYSNNGSEEVYFKTDIKRIDVFSSANNTRSSALIFYKITFKDSTEIRISGQVIPQLEFVGKFPETLLHYRRSTFNKF